MIQWLLADICTTQSLFPDLWHGLRAKGSCEVVIDSTDDILTLIGNAIEILMIVAAMVAIGFIIVGGFTYITSSGDPAGIKKGRDIIINAIVGLFLALLAAGIVRYVTGQF